jgi:hypothetical protein
VLPLLQDGEGFVGAYVMLSEDDRAQLLTLWRDARTAAQEDLFERARVILSASGADVAARLQTWPTVLPAGPRGLLVKEALLRL